MYRKNVLKYRDMIFLSYHQALLEMINMWMDFKAERLMEMAEKLLKSRAEAGDTQASFLLGHLYYEEVIIPQVYVCETQWF